MRLRFILYYFLLCVAGIALFVPFIGDLHLFDWDEINFAESAREMILTKNYLTVQINFEPFWEKPPLFIWMQVLSMKIFGIGEFAARFPDAVCGIFTILVLFKLGRIFYNPRFGFLWVTAFVASFLPFLYFKSGIIDPWFNLFIFLGIFFFFESLHKEKQKKIRLHIILSAMFIGLGIMTKGPVAFLIFFLAIAVYWILNRFKSNISLFNIALFLIVVIFVGGFWYMLLIIKGNFNLILEFIQYQIRLFKIKDAGHGGFPLYHFVILLFGVFPSSIFCLAGFKKGSSDTDYQKDFKKWMIILLFTALILFSIVKTKIVHYSSLCYFPISFLAAHAIDRMLKKEIQIKLWHKILFAVVGGSIGLIIILLPTFDMFKQKLIKAGIISHPFTVGNLQANPGWGFTDSLAGIILISGIILFLIFIWKKNVVRGISTIYVSSLIFIYLAIVTITPKIEEYSQKAVIDFYKKAGQNGDYVYSFYKSYAVLFYTNKKLSEKRYDDELEWMLNSVIDRNVYFTMRIDKKNEILKNYPQLEVMYEKNGYVFCKKRL